MSTDPSFQSTGLLKEDVTAPSKKVLIVTYYWPPSGGSGVQRWLKMVKYLPSFGWKPFVYTPENPSFEIRDDTLLADVPAEAVIIRKPIWEPYKLFKNVSKIVGGKPVNQIDMVSADRKSFFQKVSSWVRGNIFIPDPRVMWVSPSFRFLKNYITENDIQVVVTTGPPHSLHLIGLRLRKKLPSIKWVADFRDPWSEWDLLDTLSLSARAREKHRRLEKDVLKHADRVLTIAPFHVNRLEELGQRHVDLLTNGFDEEDFRSIVQVHTSRFTIRHIGQVDELRDPRPFMRELRKLAVSSQDFRDHVSVEFVGPVNTSFKNEVERDEILSKFTTFIAPLPHTDLLKLYGSTDMQLLVLAHTTLAPGNLPGKLFEYLASGNFIFGIGPADGDAAAILSQTHAGMMIERSDSLKIHDALLQRFDIWKSGVAEKDRDVLAFSRKFLAKKLADYLGS